MKAERRTWRNSELRVAGTAEAPKIQGYAAVFDSPSEDLGSWLEVREEIDPHAFDTVLASNPDVRALFNHDDNLVLGRTIAGTLSLSVDARGLFYEVDPPDTQVARDLMVSMRRKDITGSSFSFICKRDQWTDNTDGSVTRRILEFDSLFDVSPVTFPAYPASSTEARSLPASMPAEMRARLEARRGKQAPAEQRANADTGCGCDCDECVAGDCQNCSDENCDAQAEGCAGCPNDPDAPEMNSSKLREADENRRLQIRRELEA